MRVEARFATEAGCRITKRKSSNGNLALKDTRNQRSVARHTSPAQICLLVTCSVEYASCVLSRTCSITCDNLLLRRRLQLVEDCEPIRAWYVERSTNTRQGQYTRASRVCYHPRRMLGRAIRHVRYTSQVMSVCLPQTIQTFNGICIGFPTSRLGIQFTKTVFISSAEVKLTSSTAMSV